MSFEYIRKYAKEMRAHLDYERDHPTENYCQPANACVDCLAWSDEFLDMRGKTPEAYRERYEFRDGAALMLASVFGYDISMARRMMRLDAAWADYERACESMAVATSKS